MGARDINLPADYSKQLSAKSRNQFCDEFEWIEINCETTVFRLARAIRSYYPRMAIKY